MRRPLLALLAVLAAAPVLAAPAAAQPADTPADWLVRPSSRDLLAVWPAEAWRRGIGGEATIRCLVTPQGAVRDCRVVEESPPGAGFGGAAITLSAQFAMKPALREGRPVASEVTIPIEFPAPDPVTGSHLRSTGSRNAPTQRVVSGLRWRAAPGVADVRAAYPAKARARKAPGLVTLDCAITREGGLRNCSTVQEEPSGYGFAQAARTLAAKFLGPTEDAAGRSLAGAHTQVRFTFAPETLDAEAPAIGKPDWTALPAPEDMAAVLPQAARQAGVLQARVILACGVAADGGLAACRVEEETPAGLGYGRGALDLTRNFRLSVWSSEGLPVVGGAVRVPIRFRFGSPPPSPAAPE